MRAEPITELDVLDRLREDEQALERDVEGARREAARIVAAARDEAAALAAETRAALAARIEAARAEEARATEEAVRRVREEGARRCGELAARAAGRHEAALAIVVPHVLGEAP
jgi:hypothetical protein